MHGRNNAQRHFQINTHMNNKTSANDLSLSIHNVYKKYAMKAYYEEYCQLMIEYANTETAEKIKVAFGEGNNVLLLHNSVVDFINTTKMTETDTIRFLSRAAEIQAKHPFEKYCRECSAIRKSFLAERSAYFYNKLQCMTIIQDSIVEEVQSYIGTFQDSLLSKWIDNSLKRIRPKGIHVKYEDLTGKVHTIYAIHKESSFTEEYNEAQLIDRYSGTGIFDSFLLHSFYNAITSKWVYVPIALIIEMKSDYIDELLDTDKEEETGFGGNNESF